MPEGGDSTKRRMKVSRRVAGPTPSAGNAAGALLAALAALEDWLGDPNASCRAMLRRSLARLTDDGGGTRLDLSLDAGQGLLGIALSVRVGEARAGDRRPGLQREVPLRLQSVDHPAGSLSGDLAPGLIELCARLTELLLDRAVVRAHMKRADDRLAALDSAVRGIAGVPSVEDVLEQIAGHVRDLVGSEYAALGIADEAGQLTQFITVGIDDARRAQIGSLPQGHGLLGVIIGNGRTVRIPDIGVDPRRVGFPPHHPAMSSFLGVPITIGGQTVGNLYLTNKRGATEFDEADERLVEMFALHAGIAVENARLHERAAAAANRDSLTGLFNRRLLDDTIDQRLAEAERGQRPLSVILLDLDHFSRVNNAYGHLVGDEVLRRVADALREAVRQSDVAVRYGGEEFLVLAPDTASPGAVLLAERIRRGVAHLGAMPIDGHVVRITVSAGVATFGGMGVPWADLLRAADAALLAAKRGGRDRTMRSTDLWPATDPSVTQP